MDAYLRDIADDAVHEDCQTLVWMMKQATRAEPKMWGTSIVGLGTHSYKYASGREGLWFLTGFAPRRRDLTLYIMSGLDRCDALLAKLGKHKTGKSCLYLKRLADVDLNVLGQLAAASVKHLRGRAAEAAGDEQRANWPIPFPRIPLRWYGTLGTQV